MNIFFIDEDPKVAARMVCDKHVTKMVLESVQMLSTAHAEGEAPYGCIKSHINHPCTKWARASRGNYQWLTDHVVEMCKEYTRRYHKVHKMEEAARWLNTNEPTELDSFSDALTEKPQCMPEHCKVKGNAVGAYRKYYLKEKSYFAKWKWSSTPEWFVEGMKNA
jgi:hypothetical protein